MSSFIVSNKLLNRIVTGLYIRKNRELCHSFRTLAEILEVEHFALSEEMIGQALHKMNCEAVKARYGSYKDMISEEYKSEPDFNASMVQIYKDIQCLSYQCAEGDIPESKLYKWLETLENTVAYNIIQELPEYENASWS